MLTRNYAVYKDTGRNAGLIVYVPRDGQPPPRDITVSVSAAYGAASCALPPAIFVRTCRSFHPAERAFLGNDWLPASVRRSLGYAYSRALGEPAARTAAGNARGNRHSGTSRTNGGPPTARESAAKPSGPANCLWLAGRFAVPRVAARVDRPVREMRNSVICRRLMAARLTAAPTMAPPAERYWDAQRPEAKAKP
jgi:hypothetical protein